MKQLDFIVQTVMIGICILLTIIANIYGYILAILPILAWQALSAIISLSKLKKFTKPLQKWIIGYWYTLLTVVLLITLGVALELNVGNLVITTFFASIVLAIGYYVLTIAITFPRTKRTGNGDFLTHIQF